ncbi:hypothetical protein Trydic_g10129 [Trypoxylus dichotomus]
MNRRKVVQKFVGGNIYTIYRTLLARSNRTTQWNLSKNGNATTLRCQNKGDSDLMLVLSITPKQKTQDCRCLLRTKSQTHGRDVYMGTEEQSTFLLFKNM